MNNKTSTVFKIVQLAFVLLFLIIIWLVSVQAQESEAEINARTTDLTAKIAAAPNEGGLYILRGTAYFKLRKTREALADADKAVQLNPKNPAALDLRGNVKSINKDYDGAIADYSQVIKLYPERAFNSYFWRGELFEVKSDLQSALADYSKALAIQPQFVPAARARDRVDARLKRAATPAKTEVPKASAGGTSDEFLGLTTSALTYLQETKVYKDKYEAPSTKSGKEGENEALRLAEIIHTRSRQTVEMLTSLISRFSGTNYPPELLQTRGKLESLLATNKRTVNDMAGAKIFHRVLILSYESLEKEKVFENEVRAAEKAGDSAAREAAYNKYVAQVKATDKIVAGGALEIGTLIKNLDQQFVNQNLRNLEITLSTTASQATIKTFLINKPPQKNQ